LGLFITPVLTIRLKTVLIENLGVLYASVALDSELGFVLLEQAVKSLLQVVDMQPTPTILWSIRYKQHSEQRIICSRPLFQRDRRPVDRS